MAEGNVGTVQRATFVRWGLTLTEFWVGNANRKAYVGLFRSKTSSSATPEGADAEPESDVAPAGGPKKKDAPTPTRKEAEAARRERLTKKRTKKDTTRANRAARMKAMQERDSTPEKALLRDYIDSRRSLGEFLLPGVLVMFVGLFLSQLAPGIASVATIVIYLLFAAVIVDMFLMWRGFKRVLADRLPRTSTRGLLMYGMNRAIQFRRFRMPKPRIGRGDRY